MPVKKFSRNNTPIGFFPRKDYPIGQIRECRRTSSAKEVPSSCNCYPNQSGGWAVIPAIAATYAALKSVQPFSKAKKALEENVSKEKQKTKWYTIPHKIASVGSSLGFGVSSKISGPIVYNRKGVTQPILQKGTGKRKARKTRKAKK